jgi:hypothetical protein
MSPHTVANFTSELVMMAKAVEELPLIREELAEWQRMAEVRSQHIQALELKAHERNQEIETLHAKVRELEVARDDAEFRFLEAEERTASALAFVRSTFGSAGALIQALDPKAEAKVIEETKTETLHDNLGFPTDSPALHSEPVAEEVQPGIETGPVLEHEYAASQQDETLFASVASEVGKSADDPTANMTASPSINASPTLLQSEDGEAVQPSDTAHSDKPYSGLCYFDVPGYLSLADWLAGGGTEALYFNRRTA